MIGREAEQNGEPPEGKRGQSPERQPMTFEMVESGPAAPARSHAGTDRRRGVVIEDPDADLVARWKAG